MRNRHLHRVLSDISALRVAERTAAHQELADARAREVEAEEAATRAEARVAAAADAWDAHLAGPFAPELARGFADMLVEQGRTAMLAGEHRLRSMAARQDAEQAWQDRDAHCRLAARACRDKAREIRRDRDEAALAVLADRTTLRWRHA